MKIQRHFTVAAGEGCKFTLWKNSLDQYGQAVTSKVVKELLKIIFKGYSYHSTSNP